jgi:hypothetical protein
MLNVATRRCPGLSRWGGGELEYSVLTLCGVGPRCVSQAFEDQITVVRHYDHYTDGTVCKWSSANAITRHSPAEGRHHSDFTAGNPHDVDLAFNAIRSAFAAGFGATPGQSRSTFLTAYADVISSQIEKPDVTEQLRSGTLSVNTCHQSAVISRRQIQALRSWPGRPSSTRRKSTETGNSNSSSANQSFLDEPFPKKYHPEADIILSQSKNISETSK